MLCNHVHAVLQQQCFFGVESVQFPGDFQLYIQTLWALVHVGLPAELPFS